MITSPTHTVPLWKVVDGAHNVRDVGGLLATTGTTRPGVLYRGDNLDRITTRGQRQLTEQLGVRTVIDLRGTEEWTAPDPAWWVRHPTRRISVPMVEEMTFTPASNSDPETALLRRYLGWLDAGGRAAAEILTVLAVSGHRPALVHW